MADNEVRILSIFFFHSTNTPSYFINPKFTILSLAKLKIFIKQVSFSFSDPVPVEKVISMIFSAKEYPFFSFLEINSVVFRH